METSLMMIYARGASRKHSIDIFSTMETAEFYFGTPLTNLLQE